MQKKHKAKQGVQKREKTKIQRKLITKKRAKEHRDRITRCESPSLRPIKKRATKWSKQLVIKSVLVLKRKYKNIHSKQIYHMAGLRETRNSGTDEQLEKPQHLDQSKSMCWNTDFNWSKEFSVSSTRRQFRYFQTIHKKQPTKLCFPNQFLQKKT